MRIILLPIFFVLALTCVTNSAPLSGDELKSLLAAIRQNRSTQADFQEQRVIRLMKNPSAVTGFILPVGTCDVGHFLRRRPISECLHNHNPSVPGRISPIVLIMAVQIFNNQFQSETEAALQECDNTAGVSAENG